MQRWHWQRWITLATLALIALGPGLFWSPSKVKASSGLSQGWMAVPLPQPLLEAKAKCNPLGPGLVVNALEPILRSHTPALDQTPLSHPAPSSKKRLYLAYARLQTDGG